MAVMTQVGIEFIARNRANAQMNSFNRTLQNMGRQMLIIAGVGGGLYGMKRGFDAVIKSASDAEEISAKFDVVFDNLAAGASKWAEDFGDTVGRATQDVKQWMAGLQDTFVPLGIAREEAAELSKSLVTLAVDVASFNNAADATVIRDFTSALVGNHETVRKYGIIISESAIKQEALRKGLDKTYKELTDLEKVQLRYSLIQQGTTDAQGDAIRTADSYANQIKRLSANFTELKTTIGEDLIPVLSELFSWVNKNWQALVKLANVVSPLLLLRKNIKALLPKEAEEKNVTEYVPSWQEQMGLDIIKREEPFFKKLQAEVEQKKKAEEIAKRYLPLLDREIAITGRIGEAHHHAAKMVEFENAIRKAGLEQSIYGIELMEDYIGKLKQIERAERLIKIAESIGESFATAFERMIFEGGRARDIITAMIRDIAMAVVRYQVTQPLALGISQAMGGFLGMEPVLGERQGGGLIPRTGLYRMHAGEDVIKAGGSSAPVINIYDNPGVRTESRGEPFFDGEKWIINLESKMADRIGRGAGALAPLINR